MRVGIVGTGIVGSAIGIKLSQKGYRIGLVTSKTRAKAEQLAQVTGAGVTTISEVIKESDVIFVTTPDNEIEPLIKKFANSFGSNQLVIHCSGALSSNILSPIRDKGAKALSLHPLQSFASVDLALQQIKGTHFSIEGDDVETGKQIVKDLEGIPHVCSTEGKALYHAGACFASNYLTVIAEIGVNLLSFAGFKEHEALNCLIPLMQSTLNNLRDLGLPNALTGPIARGDTEVIKDHLAELPDEYQEIYRLLGLRAAALGAAKGTLNSERKQKIEGLLGIGNKGGEVCEG